MIESLNKRNPLHPHHLGVLAERAVEYAELTLKYAKAAKAANNAGRAGEYKENANMAMKHAALAAHYTVRSSDFANGWVARKGGIK